MYAVVLAVPQYQVLPQQSLLLLRLLHRLQPAAKGAAAACLDACPGDVLCAADTPHVYMGGKL
jgi:hypothetical protein